MSQESENTQLEDEQILLERRDEYVILLEGTNRRQRQEASHALAQMAQVAPDIVVEIADVLVGSLSLPEAQTRWECLNALSTIALNYPEGVLDGFAGAEDALFDDVSAQARLSAFRYLSRYGSSAPSRSLEAWPLLSEALQCYHGDPEYREMLSCLLEFVRGDIDESVREALVTRMVFDSKNGRGLIRAYSREIIAVAEGQK